MEHLSSGELVPMVPRDGADDTPVKEFERYNAGQLLAKILDSDRDTRLALCTSFLTDSDTANKCRMHDHEDEIMHLREYQMRMAAERHQMLHLTQWLSMYKAIADSIISYAEHINDDQDADYSRAALAAKINGWADMAKTTQAKLREIQEASTDGGNAGASDTPNQDERTT